MFQLIGHGRNCHERRGGALKKMPESRVPNPEDLLSGFVLSELAVLASRRRALASRLSPLAYRATPIESAFHRIGGRTGAGVAPLTRVLVATKTRGTAK